MQLKSIEPEYIEEEGGDYIFAPDIFISRAFKISCQLQLVTQTPDYFTYKNEKISKFTTL